MQWKTDGGSQDSEILWWNSDFSPKMMKMFYSLVTIKAQWNIALQKHTNVILKSTVLFLLSSQSISLMHFAMISVRVEKVSPFEDCIYSLVGWARLGWVVYTIKWFVNFLYVLGYMNDSSRKPSQNCRVRFGVIRTLWSVWFWRPKKVRWATRCPTHWPTTPSVHSRNLTMLVRPRHDFIIILNLMLQYVTYNHSLTLP